MTPLPYAKRVEIGGVWYSICPVCGNHILLRHLKDFESHSAIEYADHYRSQHMEPQEAEIDDDGNLTLIP